MGGGSSISCVLTNDSSVEVGVFAYWAHDNLRYRPSSYFRLARGVCMQEKLLLGCLSGQSETLRAPACTDHKESHMLIVLHQGHWNSGPKLLEATRDPAIMRAYCVSQFCPPDVCPVRF